MSTSSTTTTSTTTSSTTSTTTSTSSSTTTTYPFYIVDVRPDAGATGIAQGVTIEADFSNPLDTSTITDSTFVVALKTYKTLQGQTVVANELVEGTIQIINGDMTVVFTPDSPLYEEADYDVVVDNDVLDIDGRTLTSIFGWSFQTGIVDEVEDEPSQPQPEPPLKDHYPRQLDGLAVVSTYPAQYAAQVPLDLAPNNGVITIQWNHEIASVGASNVAWEALNGDPNLVDARYNATHTLTIDGEFVNISLASSLVENSMVRVTLQNVRDVNGRLDREYVLFFATVINPTYATIEVIRALVGPWIDRVPDSTIAMIILEASLTVETISGAVIVNPALWELAKRKWVQCRAAYDLLFPTMLEGVGKTKRLAEMMVEWQGVSPQEKLLMYQKFKDCFEDWEEIIQNGGAEGVRPIMTIKGLYDPDRPETGRGWTKRPNAEPFANTVVPKVVGRRGIKAPRDPRFYWPKNRRGIYRRGTSWD